MPSKPLLDYDPEGVRRVARVLLRHVAPRNREEAHYILEGRLGVYAMADSVLRAEINRYFGESQSHAA